MPCSCYIKQIWPPLVYMIQSLYPKISLYKCTLNILRILSSAMANIGIHCNQISFIHFLNSCFATYYEITVHSYLNSLLTSVDSVGCNYLGWPCKTITCRRGGLTFLCENRQQILMYHCHHYF